MRSITKLLLLSLFSVFVCFTSTAEAVIPQLIGPLTALLAIIPQILAFVGIALVTSLIFARDTTKSIFYKIRGFFTMKRSIISVISLFVLVGLAVLTFYLVDISVEVLGQPLGVMLTALDALMNSLDLLMAMHYGYLRLKEQKRYSSYPPQQSLVTDYISLQL